MGAGEQVRSHGERPGALSGRVRIAPDREMELSVDCTVRSSANHGNGVLPPESLLVQVTRFGVALGQWLAGAGTPPVEIRLRATVDARQIELEVHGRGAGLDEHTLRQAATETAAQRQTWNGPRSEVMVHIVAVHVTESAPPVAPTLESTETKHLAVARWSGRRHVFVWGGLAAAVLALFVVAIVADSRAPSDQSVTVAGTSGVPSTPLAAAAQAPTAPPPTAVLATALPPTPVPTAVPTLAPAVAATAVPTLAPTAVPTAVPTAPPTAVAAAAPTAVPTALPTAVAAFAPTAVPTVPVPRTVLDARFGTGALAGWPNAATGVAWFAPDGYHLRSRTPGRFVAIQAPNASAGNVGVTLRYRKVSGPPGGGVGVILRDQERAGQNGLDQGGRFYVLEVSDRGEVGIWRREVDTWIDLVAWTRSDAVQPATAGNVIEARASGPRLTLLVNSREAATATDAVLTSGGVGVFLGGDDNEAVLEQLSVQPLD